MIPSGNDIKLLITTINDLYKKGMTIEAQEKIMELREMLLDLREQNVDLRQENSELKKKLDEKAAVVFESGVYWTKVEGGDGEGPFCARCHDKDGKLCRMFRSQYHYKCLSCSLTVEHTARPPRQPAHTPSPFSRGRR